MGYQRIKVSIFRPLAVFIYCVSFFVQPILPIVPAEALTVTPMSPVTPNDPFVKKQTHLDQVNARAAWGLTTGSVRTTVALIDSGVDINHPDLRDNIWVNQGEIPGDGVDNDGDGYVDDVNGWDFANEVPDPSPKFSSNFRPAGIQHGTLLAGIIAGRGNNGFGIAGISWRTKILPLRVLDGNGDGDIINVIRAIDFAIAKRVDVINMSFVGDTEVVLFRDVIKRAHDAGIVVVAATGNDENRHGVDLKDQLAYPACYDFNDNAVIGVASLDEKDQKAPFSNYGKCIDIFAPGVGIFSTQVVNYDRPGFDTYYGSGWTGTSLSTAIVSGAAALVRSIDPDFTPKDVSDILFSTCSSIDTQNPEFFGKLGCGKLDIFQAVEKAITLSRAASIPVEEAAPSTALYVYPLSASGPGVFLTKDGASVPRAPFLPFGKGVPFTLAVLKSHTNVFYVAGAGRGSVPLVRVFDSSFHRVTEFMAYDRKFRGGVSVAVGDVNGDGSEDIITAPGSGGGPHVKVFDQFGSLKYHFLAYAPSFRDGLSVLVGDMNNDGRADIVTTPQRNNQGDVRIFSTEGVLRTQFFAYPKSKNGARLALGDLDGDGTIEIVASPIVGAAPVKIFSSLGKLKSSFYPFDKKYSGGISISLGDINQDRRDSIICSPAGVSGPQVRIFTAAGRVTSQFFGPKEYRKGIGVVLVH